MDKRRVGRTNFEYECKVRLKNYAMFAVKNVELSFDTDSNNLPGNMTIIDPNVSFSYIPANGLAESEDTCRFRVDRLSEINPSEIIWDMGCQIEPTGTSRQFRGSSTGLLEAERRN